MTNDNIVNELIEYANKNPLGFTVEIINGKITQVTPTEKNRFVCAIKQLIVIDNFKETVTQYKEVIRKQSFIIYPFLPLFKPTDKKIFIGGWFSDKENKYYIEIVNIFDSLTEVMITGKLLYQYSVYNLLEKKEIVVNDYFNKLEGGITGV
jgi:hypothetical protein